MSFKNYLNVALSEADEKKELEENKLEWLLFFFKRHASNAEIPPISKAEFEEIQKQFPSDETTVYLGVNFRYQESWDKFYKTMKRHGILSSLIDHELVYKSKDKNETKKHALDLPVMHEPGAHLNHNKASSSDHMNGHAGATVELTIKKGAGVDLGKAWKYLKENPSAAPETGLTENVGIVLPGDDYPAKIVETHVPWSASMNKHNIKEHFMSIKTLGHEDEKSSFDTVKFNYIVKNYDEFDDEMRHHLYKLSIQDKSDWDSSVTVNTPKNTDWSFSWEGDITLNFHLTVDWNLLRYYRDFTDADRHAVDKIFIKYLKTLDKQFKVEMDKLDKPLHEHQFVIKMHGLVEYLVKIEDFYDKCEFAKYLNKEIGKRYNFVNSREWIQKNINNPDKREQSDAIRKHGEDVAKILNQTIHTSPSYDVLRHTGLGSEKKH